MDQICVVANCGERVQGFLWKMLLRMILIFGHLTLGKFLAKAGGLRQSPTSVGKEIRRKLLWTPRSSVEICLVGRFCGKFCGQVLWENDVEVAGKEVSCSANVKQFFFGGEGLSEVTPGGIHAEILLISSICVHLCRKNFWSFFFDQFRL